MTCAINGRSLRDGTYGKGGGPAAILIHPGANPSSLIGCVGVRRREGNASKQPAACVLEILDPSRRVQGGEDRASDRQGHPCGDAGQVMISGQSLSG